MCDMNAIIATFIEAYECVFTMAVGYIVSFTHHHLVNVQRQLLNDVIRNELQSREKKRCIECMSWLMRP